MTSETKQSLGEPYPLTQVEDASRMQERILIESAILFAKQGYVAVSMKDISSKVGIRPASLYNHYESKEALWEAVIDHVESLYMQYFGRLEKACSGAQTFEELLECMFLELKEVVDIFTYYGFSLIQTEQFRCEKSSRIYREVFYKYSTDFIAGQFDRCVSAGLVAPFDTQACATFFMHTVLAGINMRVHEHLGRETAYDVTAMFTSLQNYILDSVTVLP